jgi:hypothetical protein
MRPELYGYNFEVVKDIHVGFSPAEALFSVNIPRGRKERSAYARPVLAQTDLAGRGENVFLISVDKQGFSWVER